MCMRTVDDLINIYSVLSQLIDMKGKQMRHVHLYEDIVNHSLSSMHCICDMGYIFIAGANFMKFAYVVINNVYYDISRNIMFNTNSQVNVDKLAMHTYQSNFLNKIVWLIITLVLKYNNQQQVHDSN